MRQTLITCLFALAASTAQSEDAVDECAALGIENAYLADHFCAQLDALAAPSGGTTRSIVPEGDPDQDLSPIAEWEAIGLIQDAYRADPRKTLELIERIKGVGGLASDVTN